MSLPLFDKLLDHSKLLNPVRVWDLAVRVFHWALVISFLVTYLSEDQLGIHAWAGYVLAALLFFRLLWGFIGTPYARWWQFVRRPATVLAYLRKIRHNRAERYLGHNPAGGAMVVALMLSLSLAVLSGLLAYGSAESAGLLASWFVTAPAWMNNLTEGLHELFVNLSLLLVCLHIAGVLLASFQHRENLPASMLHGYKRSED